MAHHESAYGIDYLNALWIYVKKPGFGITSGKIANNC
jgi:hypothetical protein